jgi:hypothetical protein
MTDTPEKKKPPIVVHEFCRAHARALVLAANLGPDDPWRAGLVVAQLITFQALMNNRRIITRLGANPDSTEKIDLDVDTANLVFAEIGCPLCFSGTVFRAVRRIMARGMDHAAAVAKFEVLDPDATWITPTSLQPPRERPE